MKTYAFLDDHGAVQTMDIRPEIHKMWVDCNNPKAAKYMPVVEPDLALLNYTPAKHRLIHDGWQVRDGKAHHLVRVEPLPPPDPLRAAIERLRSVQDNYSKGAQASIDKETLSKDLLDTVLAIIDRAFPGINR